MSDLDTALLQTITNELCSIGVDESSFSLSVDELVDDEYRRSVLVTVDFKKFHADDGQIAPLPVHLQFDYDKEDGGDWCMIVGEDTERAITTSTLYAALYFSSLPLDPQQPVADAEEGHYQ